MHPPTGKGGHHQKLTLYLDKKWQKSTTKSQGTVHDFKVSCKETKRIRTNYPCDAAYWKENLFGKISRYMLFSRCESGEDWVFAIKSLIQQKKP